MWRNTLEKRLHAKQKNAARQWPCQPVSSTWYLAELLLVVSSNVHRFIVDGRAWPSPTPTSTKADTMRLWSIITIIATIVFNVASSWFIFVVWRQ